MNPLPESGGFYLRELSRLSKLAPKSVSIYLKELENESFISRGIVYNRPVYRANRDSEKFKLYKKLDMISEIKESGLIDYLYDKIMPDCMILFGSSSRGEDVAGSDIDIFVQCKETHIDLEKFEKKLGRKINLLFSERFGKLSVDLKNNIINGTLLKGFLKVF